MIFPNQAGSRHPLHVDRLISSQVVLVGKNLPASSETQEMGVRSLDQEDPLEKGMATYFSILAWRIPWTEGPEMQWIMQQTGGILPLQPNLLHAK